MHVGKEIQAMKKRMFTGELLDSLLNPPHWGDVPEDDAFSSEAEQRCRQALATLCPVLDSAQLQALGRLDALFRDSAASAVDFAFGQGCCALFQQFFTDSLPVEPFQHLALNPFLKNDFDLRLIPYRDRRGKAIALLDSIADQLPEDYRQDLVALESVWDERLYNAMRQAFYLGYRFALDAVDRGRASHRPISFAGKILITEYELGITSTQEEREIREED